jgi:hypothetical protein
MTVWLCLARRSGRTFFNSLLVLFIGMLSRPKYSLFVATAPGVNVLVTSLDEKSKHFYDFRLSF